MCVEVSNNREHFFGVVTQKQVSVSAVSLQSDEAPSVSGASETTSDGEPSTKKLRTFSEAGPSNTQQNMAVVMPGELLVCLLSSDLPHSCQRNCHVNNYQLKDVWLSCNASMLHYLMLEKEYL